MTLDWPDDRNRNELKSRLEQARRMERTQSHPNLKESLVRLIRDVEEQPRED